MIAVNHSELGRYTGTLFQKEVFNMQECTNHCLACNEQEWGISHKSVFGMPYARMGDFAQISVWHAICRNGGFCTNRYLASNMQEWGISHKSLFCMQCARMGDFAQITVWHAIRRNGGFRTNHINPHTPNPFNPPHPHTPTPPHPHTILTPHNPTPS